MAVLLGQPFEYYYYSQKNRYKMMSQTSGNVYRAFSFVFAFLMYGGLGMSAHSLHRESTDYLISGEHIINTL